VARIDYDEPTASAYKAVREIPRAGLEDWRAALEQHVRPAPGMTLVDVGAGTGQFAAAFADWFEVHVVAVEPSDAMRERIPRTPRIDVRAGEAEHLPLPDDSVDAAWISNVLHHIPDLAAAAAEIARVLRPGAPLLIRAGMSGTDNSRIELVRWFPETERTIDTYPSVEEACAVFGAAGFRREALEKVAETRPGTLADFLDEIDTLRGADTTLRGLTDDEFERGRNRLREAVAAGQAEPRTNWLDLLVLRAAA
jgi:ubiquinone/menaquinone biosynthesis C-methylase UbiE